MYMFWADTCDIGFRIRKTSAERHSEINLPKLDMSKKLHYINPKPTPDHIPAGIHKY